MRIFAFFPIYQGGCGGCLTMILIVMAVLVCIGSAYAR